MAIATFTAAGAKATKAVVLDQSVFGIEAKNHALLKEAYIAHQANARENLAVVKTRGLVSGGGRKPWKQKGTGRARFGSSRNPIWRGGGIVFGPTGEENYSKRINVKAKRQAIRQALTVSAASNKVAVIESLTFSTGKTSEAAKLLAAIGANRTTLVIVENKTPELIRATRNLQQVKLVTATYLNVVDILNANHVVVSKDALTAISTWLGETK